MTNLQAALNLVQEGKVMGVIEATKFYFPDMSDKELKESVEIVLKQMGMCDEDIKYWLDWFLIK